MHSRNVLVFETRDVWASFLKEVLADTGAEVFQEGQAVGASATLDRIKPAMVFCEPGFLTRSVLQKLKVRRETDLHFRFYLLGEPGPAPKDVRFDGVFPVLPQHDEFLRRFSETLPMPETVRLLVVDDEEEISGMIRDHFEERRSPAFQVSRARDGQAGLRSIESAKPDVIVLDIKMPGMDGREFYAELRRRKMEVPVIIFFDSISGEEIEEIRKYGHPPVVEKGTPASTLPSLMALVKTILFFGA